VFLNSGVLEGDPERHLHVRRRELDHALFGSEEDVCEDRDGSLARCGTGCQGEAGGEFVAGAGQAHGGSVPTGGLDMPTRLTRSVTSYDEKKKCF
jgi:hypothetical protein